jgi:hypothetical protein
MSPLLICKFVWSNYKNWHAITTRISTHSFCVLIIHSHECWICIKRRKLYVQSPLPNTDGNLCESLISILYAMTRCWAGEWKFQIQSLFFLFSNPTNSFSILLCNKKIIILHWLRENKSDTNFTFLTTLTWQANPFIIILKLRKHCEREKIQAKCSFCLGFQRRGSEFWRKKGPAYVREHCESNLSFPI